MWGAAEEEFQELTPSELRVCRAIVGSNGLPAAQLPDDILQALHKRGLVYLDVPVLPTDHVSIPPLEVPIAAVQHTSQTAIGTSISESAQAMFKSLDVTTCHPAATRLKVVS